MINKKHYYWLDLIRVISALLVVMVHVRCEFINTYTQLEVESQNLFTQFFFFANSFGTQAVLIFFILSGFLVGGRTIERILDKSVNLKDYIIDRSVRIFTPLIASIVLIVIIDQFTKTPHSIWELIGNLLGLQGVLVGDAGGVFWTLAYEIWFYVLIGAIICLTISKNKSLGFTSIFLALVVFANIKTYLLFFLILGIIGYYLSKNKLPKYIVYVSIIVCITSWILINFASETLVKDRLTFDLISIQSLSLIFGASITIVISQIVNIKPTGKLSKLDKIGSKLSVFSYSLYITHYQCCRIMHFIGVPKLSDVNISTILWFVFEIICCIIFAYIFYLLTEKHTNKIKSIIKYYI